MAPGNRPSNRLRRNPFSGENSLRYMRNLRDKAKETALPHLKQSFYPPDVKNFYQKKGIKNLNDYDSKAGFNEIYEYVGQSNKKGAKIIREKLQKLNPYRDLLALSISESTVRKKIKKLPHFQAPNSKRKSTK